MSSTRYKQVIVVRKDLGMRKGKLAAQVAHASLGALLRDAARTAHPDRPGGQVTLDLDEGAWGWLTDRFTKVVVGVDSEQALLDIQAAARAAGLRECLIQDAGFTEFRGVPTLTTLSVGPDLSEKVDAVTGHLSLM